MAVIALDDVVAAHSERAVRTAATRFGVSLREAKAGPIAPALNARDRRELIAAARRRGLSANDLAGLVLHVVVRDRLISAVIDDGR